jgi:putative ABC transport system permease protein
MVPSLHEWMKRLRALFQNRRLNREIAEELQFHQALLREKLLRQGVPQVEVDLATRRAFGNARRWQERLRELWQFKTLENFLRDLGFSVRLLSKSPGFTAVAILTLAVGVGANTAVFSLINALLLRPLPVPHAEQLVVLRMDENGPQPNYGFCTPFFRGLEERHDTFADIFAFNGDTFQVQGRSGNENIPGMLVSGEFFQALETPPLLGRYLTPQDDQPGGSPAGLAVVISEDFWNHWFNRAPYVVGRKMVIANTPFVVVGVMPKRFIGADPTQRPMIFAPLSADPIMDAPRDHISAGIHAWWITVVARLEPGVTLDQTNARLLAISSPILQQTASDASYIAAEENAHFHFVAEPGSRGYTYVRSLFRKPLVAMFVMCAGILLLACLNLASLLMARGAARERELATRLAMGATRRRLMQQLLTESLLIALLGTGCGILAASLVSHSLAVLLVRGNSFIQNNQIDTSVDLRVFSFAAIIAIVSTVLIGFIPALEATSGNLSDHIKHGRHTRRPHELRVLAPLLLASEVAVAMILVVGAGLLATSVVRLFKSGVGFDPKGLINVAFSMDKQPLKGDALMRLYQQLGEGLSHQPGVRSVSFQFIVPLSHRHWTGLYSAPGEGTHNLNMNSVAPNYFETMRIPLYLGREFSWDDTNASGLKMILNQSAAKLLFPGREALGQQVMDPRDKTSYQVVAVVGDTKYQDLREPATPGAYVPITQDPQEKPSLSAAVRMDGPQAPLAGAVHELASRVAPAVPAPVLTTMDDVLNASMSAERMMAALSLFFAGCALLVTGIGLYGTLAYATARRTNEIGIRMALGAQRAAVMAMVFRENAAIAAVGSLAGLIAALLASRTLASFLYDTSPRDPWVLVTSVAAQLAIAGAATVLPALRAARIEPMTAIRNE